MEERIRKMKEKQKIRRELLAKQLGVGGADKLSDALGGSSDVIDDKKPSSEETFYAKICKIDSSAAGADFARTAEKNDDETQVEVYKDSSTFLKGTQSLNPHNDYCQNYVDTGQRPQNFIRDVGLAERFGEYPKLKELIRLKDEVIRTTNTPPAYFKCDLKDKFDFRQLGCKFDVILLEPPLVEYRKQAGLPLTGAEMTWDDVIAMDIETAAAQRSFIFLWCGSCEGLDFGRRCLKRWGYRRCEDICWIKTNLKKQTQPLFDDSLFVHTKEHCLMGIHGTVRRSTDGDFIHANVDIDLIIDEESEPGNSEKPEEIFHIIEHFCLGRRRLHLFGRDTSIRPGWLTVGPQLTASNFDKETYNNHFRPTAEMPNAHVTGCTDEIERLRPKTPPPRGEKKAADGGRGGQAAGGRGRNNSNRGTSIPRANLTPRVDQGAAPAPQNWHGGASGNPQISANLTPPFFDQRGAGDGRNAVPRKRDLSWDRSGGGGGRRGGMRPNHRGGQRGGGGNPNC